MQRIAPSTSDGYPIRGGHQIAQSHAILRTSPIDDDIPPMKSTPLKFILTCTTGLVLALASLSAAAKGDPVEGKKLVYTCTGCHGIPEYKNAYPNYHVPKLGGQNEQYLINALTEYKKGERAHPTMRAQAESFSAQDIENIAAYLSSVGTGSEK